MFHELAAGFWHFACHLPSDLLPRDDGSDFLCDLLRNGPCNIQFGMLFEMYDIQFIHSITLV